MLNPFISFGPLLFMLEMGRKEMDMVDKTRIYRSIATAKVRIEMIESNIFLSRKIHLQTDKNTFQLIQKKILIPNFKYFLLLILKDFENDQIRSCSYIECLQNFSHHN